ncbi:hypothetical protein AB4251_22335 [Vibrio lentus]|uniref:Hemolysin n=1 Tax=Vibrio lentus TaxID=136468 RepID=A0AB36XJ71_9VIBR|nr:hypothetical protein [Vibrio lentus]MCC4840248.1 hypothetical protein [Vibrio lentus]PMI12442.1 hypothetical protein BCU51_24690 [Vibrio lentus]PMK32632.1 hypothetical protein BCU02_24515 [Vibrio lentus]PMK44956.1 hypothetical protein BCT99_04980 [Vibrio lentus]PML30009.1 hypothetical protein BCT79_23420 [Vibrio lentus]
MTLIKLSLLVILLYSSTVFCSSNGPKEEPFSSLYLEGTYANLSPNSKIYANNRMQAEIEIYYQLKPNYTFNQASIKKLYTAEEIDSLSVSDTHSGYVLDIRLGDGSNRNRRGNGYSRISKFVSGNRADVYHLCVQATANNNTTGETVTQSTCSGTTNKSSVIFELLTPRTFTSSDFTYETSNSGWINGTIVHLYKYKPNNFTLHKAWHEGGLRLNSQPYRVLGTYSNSQSSSALYWIYNTDASSINIPFSTTFGTGWKDRAIYGDLNTNEAILFTSSFGRGIYSNDSANISKAFPPYKWNQSIRPGGKRVYFEDKFGNRGHFTFSRISYNDYFEEGYYLRRIHSEQNY